MKPVEMAAPAPGRAGEIGAWIGRFWSDTGHSKLAVRVCYIVGCGRSGSTILAEILSHYSSVVFLNEPRQLWLPLVPLDVWSTKATGRLQPEVAGGEAALGEAMGTNYQRVAQWLAPEREGETLWILEKMGGGGACYEVDPDSVVKEERMVYAGEGRGSYQQVSSMEFAGKGNGNYEKEKVVVKSGPVQPFVVVPEPLFRIAARVWHATRT
eukprot:g33317.t2